ncbi:MAG: LamG domain-containing protein, partial [Candidatus Paceibacterota bacterium]
EVGSNLSLTPPTRDMGLVGYWPFDEATGTIAYDRSGNGNNGTTLGGNPGRLTSALCKVNNCLSSIAGDRISIPDSPSLDIPSALTIAAWFYPVGPNVDYANFPISKQNSTADANYVWYWFGSGAPNPGLNGLLANMGGTWSYASYGFTIPPATYNTAWSHVVYTYQTGVGGKTYVNGSLVGAQTTLKQNLATNTANAYLTPGNARMDDLRIYNRALSASEIQALYNATK